MGILIKMNDSYYNPTIETYDTTTKSYTPLSIIDEGMLKATCSNSTLTIESLFTEITIDEEVFKPIDKFEDFSIISSNNINLSTQGIKTTKQLIVQSNDCRLDLGVIKYLNNLILEANFTNEEDCKVVLSTDSGNTWKYWNGLQFVTLNTTTPLKNFSELSTEEVKQWSNFLNEVDTNGMNISTLNTIDFTYASFSKIRVAMVITRKTYDTQSILTGLTLKYEEFAHLERMNKNTEYLIDMYDSGLKMTSLIDNQHIELYALTRETKLPNPPLTKKYLDTPILSAKEDTERNMVELTWEKVDNAFYYKVFLNGEEIQEVLENSFLYILNDDNLTYSFCVRAYPSNATNYRASLYSNAVFISKLNLLGIKTDEEIRYIAVKVDGEIMKIRIN